MVRITHYPQVCDVKVNVKQHGFRARKNIQTKSRDAEKRELTARESNWLCQAQPPGASIDSVCPLRTIFGADVSSYVVVNTLAMTFREGAQGSNYLGRQTQNADLASITCPRHF